MSGIALVKFWWGAFTPLHILWYVCISWVQHSALCQVGAQKMRINKSKKWILNTYYESGTLLCMLGVGWVATKDVVQDREGFPTASFPNIMDCPQCRPSLLTHYLSTHILSCLFSDELSPLAWTSSTSYLHSTSFLSLCSPHPQPHH